MEVYDGLDTRAPLIGRYCGQQRNVVIYSTEHFMLVTFTTLKRTADSQNRGFLAKYEFSESFVKLGKPRVIVCHCFRHCSRRTRVIEIPGEQCAPVSPRSRRSKKAIERGPRVPRAFHHPRSNNAINRRANI